MKNTMRDLANTCVNASGTIVKTGESSEKNRILEQVSLKKASENHKSRLVHMHDLEFYDSTYNCIGVRAVDLIREENVTFRGAIRRLNRGIIALTNVQAGGIGFLNFDTDMERYVSNETVEELAEEFRELFCDLNVFSRKGCEKAYVTFNFGLGHTENARKVAFALLEAYSMGDENGKPFVFPNLVFKMKNVINVNPDAPNYDLFLAALKLTSKRMVPTYFNCDSESNKGANPARIGIMGCRTRVVDNQYGENSGLNRGNIACVTMNLVQLAYQSVGNVELFFKKLSQTMDEAKDSLLHRYNSLLENGNFSEVYRMGVYKDSETRNPQMIFRNGTLSIGFIGLWDALSVIYQKEWHSIADMEPYLEEAYHIVNYMRTMTNAYAIKTGLNFSLLASAAEGVTGNFAKYDALHLGKGKQVADKGYYSNSFHVPVNVETDYIEKVQFEGRFHHLCNGGSITYVELDEIPDGNIEAVKEIVEYAYRNDCNYIGINFPLDNCQECDYVGKIQQKCPCCGSNNVRRLRRVSGYLAEVDRFVQGKKYELFDRRGHKNLGS